MDTVTPTIKGTISKSSDVIFRKLFYESKDLLLIFDFQEDKAVDVNESTLIFSGYSREEFMQLSRYDLTPKYSDFSPNIDLHKTYVDAHAKKVMNGESIVELGIFKKKDGSEVYAELEIIPTGRKTGEAFIIIRL